MTGSIKKTGHFEPDWVEGGGFALGTHRGQCPRQTETEPHVVCVSAGSVVFYFLKTNESNMSTFVKSMWKVHGGLITCTSVYV